MSHNAETFVVALMFSAIFFFGDKIHFPAPGQIHYRRMISFAAGISVAYVFIQLLPEWAHASEVFVEKTKDRPYPFAAYRVHISAMVGFMLFYGLEYMWVGEPQSSERKGAQQDSADIGFAAYILGFASYVWFISYFLVRNISEEADALVPYAIAMGFHFLTINFTLSSKGVAVYQRWGRRALALSALLGWLVGVFLEFSIPLAITLMGIVSGGIIVNSMISELPERGKGRFLYFLLGGGLYSWLVLAAR